MYFRYIATDTGQGTSTLELTLNNILQVRLSIGGENGNNSVISPQGCNNTISLECLGVPPKKENVAYMHHCEGGRGKWQQCRRKKIRDIERRLGQLTHNYVHASLDRVLSSLICSCPSFSALKETLLSVPCCPTGIVTTVEREGIGVGGQSRRNCRSKGDGAFRGASVLLSSQDHFRHCWISRCKLETHTGIRCASQHGTTP